MMDIFLKLAALTFGLLAVLSVLASSLTWPLKIRIVLAVIFGVCVIGILCFSLVAPKNGFEVINMPDAPSSIILVAVSLVTGFICYFLTWPFGKYLAPVAVPAGLAAWAIKTEGIATVMQAAAQVDQRLSFYRTLMPEPFFFLAMVAAGFLGTWIAAMMLRPQRENELPPKVPVTKKDIPTVIAAMVASAAIALFAVNILAQDVRIPDPRYTSVVAQPHAAQIAFAVLVSFAIAGFVVQKIIHANILGPILATTAVSLFGLFFYTKKDTLQYLSENFPPVFFTNSNAAILPVQMISFGTLGVLAGYWLARSYEHFKHQQQ